MQDLVERRARDDPNPRDRGSRDRVFVWKGFRRKYNDRVAANLLSNAKLAMCPEVELTLDLVRKFARRARDYMRAYNNPHNPVAFKMIEDICRTVKSHRGVRSADLGFL